MLSEVKKQLCLAGPLVAGFLLQYAVQMVSVMFVGHLGELALAGAAVAASFAAATGFGLLLGMVSGLDTLCGQAFGAGEHRQLGVHKHVPVAALWACAGKVLALCGQDPEIAAAAGSYIRWLIPALFAFAAALGHPAVCWLLVRRLGFGFRGAALANGVSYVANLLFLALYVRFSPSCKTTWQGFSREALRGIAGFLKLAMPSALMMCIEGWSFELLLLLSGLLPHPKLETAGLSICIRVSNELGAGRPQAARLATRAVKLLAFCVGMFQGLLVLLLRNILGHAYSNDMEVIKYTRRMLPLVAASIMLDCQQTALSGVVRGCGWQKRGAFINLAAYYLVGIPAAVTFAFVCHLRGMVFALHINPWVLYIFLFIFI
ncbi:hypothetical protein HU200_011895 [Digitaria exilis]|uniref:MATE efflux family protein n=1 Tax=Digitaria exilis TaxID=1010633 RepID=A0A835KMB5_9POAL|nr:hypothetical protein HU200_011895 [Digitaria exilis]